MRALRKSITWRLQFWHATILLCVVVGLSTAWFLQTRRVWLSEIDASLLSAARVLDGSLRGFRFSELERNGARSYRLTPSDNRQLSLPRNEVEAGEGTFSPYFAIWLRGGQLLKSERLPASDSAEYDETLNGVGVIQRGVLREIRIVGPSGSQILVGRNVSQEFAALRRLAAQIAATAIAILMAGLLGGWWLSQAVLRPISVMSEAASKFSATNTSPRIDVVETETELGQLASLLNEAFDRVQLSFEQQRRFAADASHELRTPLAVIQSQIELALRKERTPDEYTKTLTTCGDASERLSELVESLLTLAGFDAGEEEHSVVRLDLVAAKCVDLVRPVAEHAEVHLITEFERVRILGDQNQIEQMILNLLKNAITYNRPDGTVKLVVKKTGNVSQLIVRDTGIGIDGMELPHVTKRFYRIDKARSRKHGGSGLGLSIVERIVEAHGGSMRIDSTLGKGTTVKVQFKFPDD